ncbi:TRAP transporter fused permease subunit [Siccirubricoccus sp. KC 17139]|uniref:TRAP transporter fused permease subunit n=1 Tax=Siccirubricoccus soli TaxID=2899147 RepID=A0ABT1CYK6_9PROT|nr:TRAP transporter fused permease subunit [Siccirubricoccus soli]MCO6414739.1 TRAP transporter fused permease subunit [Siccirubricoccus soli]MCP2680869.1 TRAP transporter fused permease subunit [Siccirubricoccus soli]
MSANSSLPPEVPEGALDDTTAKRIEALIEEEEGAQNRFSGWLGWLGTGLALAMALFHLWAAWDIVPTTTLRFAHVGFAMGLGFLLFPVARRWRHRLMPWDMLLIAASLYVTWYLLWGGDAIGVEPLIDRYVFPEFQDLVVGWILVALVLEVTRRATGWVMPVVAGAFMLYAFFGNLLPPPWQHQGYGTERLIPHLTITLDGIFGTAVDVSASLIILFTIYGAILQMSGAGKFFVDFSFAVTGGKAASAGRTVVLSSFLLGGPSGSGVATTVTLGTVAWPMMRRVGYRPDDAGGLLAAGGLGAIISPPVLGAAAFLIAEYLKLGYLEVLRMAAVPTVLYYASLLFMVELDQRRIGAAGKGGEAIATEGAWALTKKYGFHFSSLVAIVVFMVLGYSPTMSVLYAMVVAVLLSFLRAESALWPKRLVAALAAGAVQSVGIAATCACAGIIVGVITLTGLGLKFSEIAIQAAGGSLVVTALYTALIVWIVGLAVPVTASYIICAVVAAPALIKLGVPDYAAHMFVFYYAVLSEVSPPTALSPFAAAAITGAGPYRTTLQAWKYTLPAFVLPFVFVTDPDGVGLLLAFKPGMGWGDVLWQILLAAAGLAAMAAACQGFARRALAAWERVGLGIAGLLMVFPALAEGSFGNALPAPHWLGLALGAVLLALQWRGPRAATAG